MFNETPSPQAPLGSAVRIDVYSHCIVVSNFGTDVKNALLEFCRGVAHYGLKRVGRGKFVKAMLRVFVATTFDRREFRFHRNQLDQILLALDKVGYAKHLINVVHHGLFEPARVDLRYIEKRSPRDYQIPQISYVLENGVTKVITARPGRGKTFMALVVINQLRVRTFFTIRAMYIEKWIKDVKEAFNLKKGELMVIRGSAHLKSYIAGIMDGSIAPKITFCSNMTFYHYLQNYEKHPDDYTGLGYGCAPGEFFEKMGIGLRVIDEVHQDFHLNFRQDLYTHVPKTLSLSGTLESDDQFITNMYRVMFPPTERGPIMDDTSHVMVRALLYACHNPDKRLRYINKGMRSYSHVMFEQSLMKKKEELKNYIDMVTDIVQTHFVRKQETGQKCVVYCSTVDLCTIIAKHFKRVFPHLNVCRYTSDDDYEEMLEQELVVSTLKSLGTAIDIPGLRTILMTDAIGSRQANLQAVERLRVNPNFTPEFLYLVCQDIDKHMEYHHHKMDVFKNRVVGHQEHLTEYRL